MRLHPVIAHEKMAAATTALQACAENLNRGRRADRANGDPAWTAFPCHLGQEVHRTIIRLRTPAPGGRSGEHAAVRQWSRSGECAEEPAAKHPSSPSPVNQRTAASGDGISDAPPRLRRLAGGSATSRWIPHAALTTWVGGRACTPWPVCWSGGWGISTKQRTITPGPRIWPAVPATPSPRRRPPSTTARPCCGWDGRQTPSPSCRPDWPYTRLSRHTHEVRRCCGASWASPSAISGTTTKPKPRSYH
jgi:hypothetical protein